MNDHLIELNFIPNSLFTNDEGGGIQRIYNLGSSGSYPVTLSVICTPNSYGGKMGLWEAALCLGDNILNLPTSSGVLGWLTDADVSDLVRYLRGQITQGVSPTTVDIDPWMPTNRGENDD